MRTVSYYLCAAGMSLRNAINALYPNRDKASDGWIGDTAHKARKSDHNPDWDNGGIVRANDFDKDLFGVGNANNVAEANRLVAEIIKDSRVAYVIFMERIWYNPAVFPNTPGWRPYTPANKAGWFNPHKEHFHVSYRRGANWDSNGAAWNIAPTIKIDEILGDFEMFVLINRVKGDPAENTTALIVNNGTRGLRAIYYFPADKVVGCPVVTVADGRVMVRMRQEIGAL